MNTEQFTRERIARARVLANTARHATMATVNEDGTPHNTPFFLILNEQLTRIYFGSHPDSLHSKNVVRTGNMFVVVYDMMVKGGLYMKAVNGHELAGEELAAGLAVRNAMGHREGEKPIPQEYYEGGSPQRLYGADLVSFWVNVVEYGPDGLACRDFRHEIAPGDLL